MANRPGAERTAVNRAPRQRRLGVVVIDPLPVVRAGLSLLIDDRPDMEVLAEAGTVEEGLDVIRGIRRSRVVALIGLGLEGNLKGERDAFWLIRTVRERFPAVAILGCGAKADSAAISRSLFMGADGYVDKNVEPIEFLQALRRAADGEMVLAGPPAEWVGVIADGLEHQRDLETTLTAREREILVVAAQGLTAREIGEQLGVRERTVTTHLGRIYTKLGVGGRVAAIRAAANVGLVTVGPAR